jgi:starvation-inducible DNA-binding protein
MNGLTGNYNNYSAIELEKALQSWVEPYPKPIILNHDLNSEPIGRVMAAKMDKEEDGSHFVRLQVAITDPAAIQKVLDKRYLTGSVGGRAGKAVCSISGDDLASESADGRPKAQKFKRGQVYKGKLAFVDMQDISFKEYSFVNQPADSKSGVRKSSSGDVKVENSSDDWVARSSAFVLNMDEEDIYSVEEHKSILSGLKSKESKPLYLHLKGSFLTAIAVHESENYKYNSNSLLSSENDNKEDHEENSKMEESVQNEDVLAAVESLSQDLSTITAASAQGAQEPVAEPAEKEDEEAVVVAEAEVNVVASALQKVLSDTIVFYYAAHRAHWNVEGEDFSEFHELFSNIYEDAIGSIDGIAENMRKLQAFPATLTESVMNSSFKDDSVLTEAMGLASSLLEKNNAVNASVLEAFASANAANEQGIANFLAERDDLHKKWAWQLRASLKEEGIEPAKESWNITQGSEVVSESVEEQAELAVESVETEVAEESKVIEEPKAELTGAEQASEQDADDASKKLQLLEEENQKLKSALHRTLAERVVDTKIAAGIEGPESREESIVEHVKRTASSLADSLRDLAGLPVAKKAKGTMPEISSEIEAVESEDNVITIDREQEEPKEQVSNVSEQLFVDALMGRRKL